MNLKFKFFKGFYIDSRDTLCYKNRFSSEFYIYYGEWEKEWLIFYHLPKMYLNPRTLLTNENLDIREAAKNPKKFFKTLK